MYRLTREQLLSDLYEAYYKTRKHKRNKPYQLRFEKNLDENLEKLCDELYGRTYKMRPSSCFIIPRKREVFSYEFRDRVVQHLYYNYTYRMFERTFIKDSYGCIKGRGTHYGISRLEQHIRKESQNYKVPCYVMKMDIRSYFLSVNRQKLFEICLKNLNKISYHKVSKHRKELWKDVVDMEFVSWLTTVLVLQNPVKDCKIIGNTEDWNVLPYEKSMFHTPEGCGIPMGNITSQLFANVYLNELDHFMKRTLKCRHYGRYVDDFYVVSADRGWLFSIIPEIKEYLSKELGLKFHEGKLKIASVWQGIEFLGAWLKPHRIYIARDTVQRIENNLHQLANAEMGSRAALCRKWSASLNSYCGLFSHWCNYNLRRRVFLAEPNFGKYGVFNIGFTKYFAVSQFF